MIRLLALSFIVSRSGALVAALAMLALAPTPSHAAARSQADARSVEEQLHAGIGLMQRGDLLQAELRLREALQILLAAGNRLDNPALLSDVLYHLGETLRLGENYGEAERMFSLAVQIDEQRLSTDSPDLATLYSNLGLVIAMQGRPAEAEPLYRRALPVFQRAYSGDHPHTAAVLFNLANALEAQGRMGEAAPLYARALSMRLRTLDPTDPDLRAAREAGVRAYGALVTGALEQEDWLGLRQQARALLDLSMGDGVTDHRTQLLSVMADIDTLTARALNEGRYTQAEMLVRAQLDLAGLHGDVPVVFRTSALSNLAYILGEQGRGDESEALLRAALDATLADRNSTGRSLRIALSGYTGFLVARGRGAEAAEVFETHGGDLREGLPGLGQAELLLTQVAILEGLGRHAEAASVIEEVFEHAQGEGARAADLRAQAHQRRASIAYQQLQFDAAIADWRASAEISAARGYTAPVRRFSLTGMIALTQVVHLRQPVEGLESVRETSQTLLQQASIDNSTDDGQSSLRDLSALFVLHTEAAWGAAHGVGTDELTTP